MIIISNPFPESWHYPSRGMALQGPNLFVTEPIPSGHIRLKTSVGPIEIELWPRETPLACRNFVQLCLEGYYDGLIFHRVVPGFIVQTGDPTGSGTGGESVYDEGTFNDEINARLKFTRRGLVAMANLGSPHTNTSQFFITLDRTEELQDKHTIFGSVIGDTIYNVMKFGEIEIDKNERPVHPPIIKSVEVLDNPFPDIIPRITSAQRKEQARAKKEAKKEQQKEKMIAKHKALAKNKGLLSFADEEKLTETSEASQNRKLKSAHDVKQSSQLSHKIIDDRASLSQMIPDPPPSASSKVDRPPKVHEALRAVVTRENVGAAEIGRSAFPEDPEQHASQVKKKKKQEKNPQEDSAKSNDADRVKSEIREMQAELKKLSKRHDSDSEHEPDNTGTSHKPQKRKAGHDGHSLLEEERRRYQTSMKAKKNPGGDGDVLSILDGFRKRLREAKPVSKPVEATDRVDGYAGEVDPSLDGVLGDVDGDDDGWMAHSLQFRKDATADLHKVDEYAVIDPLLERKMTLGELEARKTEKRFAKSSQPRNPTQRK